MDITPFMDCTGGCAYISERVELELSSKKNLNLNTWDCLCLMWNDFMFRWFIPVLYKVILLYLWIKCKILYLSICIIQYILIKVLIVCVEYIIAMYEIQSFLTWQAHIKTLSANKSACAVPWTSVTNQCLALFAQ